MEAHHGLTVLDYAVFGIIFVSALLALMRGFVREVLSLGAWIGAYFAAAAGYPMLEPWARGYVKNPTGATALAATVVFIVVLTALTLVGYLIARMIRGRALTAIDRSLGFAFGLLRGGLVVCLLYLGASYIPWLNMDKLDKTNTETLEAEADKEVPKTKQNEKENPPVWLVDAKTRPALSYGASLLKDFIPEKDIEKTVHEYEEQKASHHTLQEQEKSLLGTGSSAETHQENPPEYDNNNRANLDHLIDEKSKQ